MHVWRLLMAWPLTAALGNLQMDSMNPFILSPVTNLLHHPSASKNALVLFIYHSFPIIINYFFSSHFQPHAGLINLLECSVVAGSLGKLVFGVGSQVGPSFSQGGGGTATGGSWLIVVKCLVEIDLSGRGMMKIDEDHPQD